MSKKQWKTPLIMAAVALTLMIQQTGNSYGSVLHGPAEETEVTLDALTGNQEVKTELKGTIEVSLISVTLPSDGVEFQVDPGAVFDAMSSPGGQITGPDAANFRVINHSVVPVRLEIAGVQPVSDQDVSFSEKFSEGPEQSFRLVEKVAEVKQPGTAILVLGRSGRRYASDADFEQYAIYPGRTSIPITDLEAEESAGLQIYGKVAADFYGAYQFTVRPTLKISAVRAQ